MIDLAKMEAAMASAKDRNIDFVRSVQLSGIRIMPSSAIHAPMLLVPEETWNALVAKFGAETAPQKGGA